jgi:hypothetical protein
LGIRRELITSRIVEGLRYASERQKRRIGKIDVKVIDRFSKFSTEFRGWQDMVHWESKTGATWQQGVEGVVVGENLSSDDATSASCNGRADRSARMTGLLRDDSLWLINHAEKVHEATFGCANLRPIRFPLSLGRPYRFRRHTRVFPSVLLTERERYLSG